MGTKKEKDELFERVIDDLKKWEEADEAKHHYMFLAKRRSDLMSTMCSCSMNEMILMLGILVLDNPEVACAVKKLAILIDRLMQSEPVYQELKDDKDFPESEKDGMFIYYFKQAVKKKYADLSELFSKSSDTDSDDEDDNEEEQS